MKFAKSLLALSLVALFWSCNKTTEEVNKLTEFDMSYSSESAVPATTYTANVPVDITTPEISTNSTSRFSSENTASNLIDEIKLTRFNITALSGNLDFLKSFTIFIKTSAGETQVASKTSIPAGATSVAADLSGTNIKDHLTKDKISFRISAIFTTGTSQEIKIKTDQTVHVKATLLN